MSDSCFDDFFMKCTFYNSQRKIGSILLAGALSIAMYFAFFNSGLSTVVKILASISIGVVLGTVAFAISHESFCNNLLFLTNKYGCFHGNSPRGDQVYIQR